MAWAPTKIRWITRTLETSTGASQVETDDGPGFAKFIGNPEGTQALFCEWVGTKAASWLGLPTFDIAAVDVDVPGLVTYRDGSFSGVGPAFIARLQDGTAWGGTTEELETLENREAVAGLIVLDTWLLNCDRYRPEGGQIRRNVRNVFLSGDGAAKGRFRLVAMDHTHCFVCGRTLSHSIKNIDRVKDARIYGHFPEFRPHLSHQAVRNFAQRLSQFTKERAAEILADVPRAWRPEVEIVTALVEFLTSRARFLGQNVRSMLIDGGELQPELQLEA